MNLEKYGIYSELVQKGYMEIDSKTLTDENIDQHFDWIINILDDGIEKESIQKSKIRFTFADGKKITFFIIEYMFNLMVWCLITVSNEPIMSDDIWVYEGTAITQSSLKKWIDNHFLRGNITKIPPIILNQTIDRSIGKFRKLENFQMYLANTVNFEDTIDLMRKYPEFNDTVHFDISNIPMEDIKDEGMKATRIQQKYIENSDHCLRDSFIAQEAINAKQYKEVSVNIGTKPDGNGGVFPDPIKKNFITGGLQSVEEIIIESSIGRQAQILQKQNVGQSGAFARNLGLNNQDSKLYPDPTYTCDTKNFETITIENQDMLDELDMRYYRWNPKGIDYCIDCHKDKDLIGKTILLRSPITCASAARGEGICYKCYGKLAYINNDINIGQIASEQLSSVYTQILLSAKHLLESSIIKMKWCPDFANFFNVYYNQINIRDDINIKGYKIIIDDYVEDEDEDTDETSEYVLSFDIVSPDGKVYTIRTDDSDEIYLHQELIEYMNSVGTNDDGVYELDMMKLSKLKGLFVIDVKNDELSKTMKAIKNIIDNKKSTKTYDRNTILSAFIKTNLSGHIKICSNHFEVLLMNQMRAADDILDLPDWTVANAPYQILTLNEALTNNRSISIRLQSSKIQKTITHPSNRRLHAPSNMDLFYMEKPQEFLNNKEYEKSNYKLHYDENDDKK